MLGWVSHRSFRVSGEILNRKGFSSAWMTWTCPAYRQKTGQNDIWCSLFLWPLNPKSQFRHRLLHSVSGPTGHEKSLWQQTSIREPLVEILKGLRKLQDFVWRDSLTAEVMQVASLTLSARLHLRRINAGWFLHLSNKYLLNIGLYASSLLDRGIGR